MEPTNEINKYIVVVYKNQKNFSSFTKRKKQESLQNWYFTASLFKETFYSQLFN